VLLKTPATEGGPTKPGAKISPVGYGVSKRRKKLLGFQVGQVGGVGYAE
jgi:hypothetical protein